MSIKKTQKKPRKELPDARLSLTSKLLDTNILQLAVEEAMYECLITDMGFTEPQARKHLSRFKKDGTLQSALNKVLEGWFGS